MALIRDVGSRRFLTLLLVSLVPIVALAVALGTVDIPVGDAVRILLHEWGLGADDSFREQDRLILMHVRLPRALLLLLVGGALALAGGTLQSTFQNAMAAPGILGISGGAALGAVLILRSGLADDRAFLLPLAAFAGAMVTTFLVFFLSHLGGRPTMASLLLTGVAVASLTVALMTLAMLWTEEFRLKQVLYWTVGGGDGQSWAQIGWASLPILLGSGLICLQHRTVDALTLGEEHALSVGVPVAPVRLRLLTLTALIAGAAVSVAGTIGFVGLIVPHVVRLLVGQRARVLLPSAFLLGGAFLVLCDLIARVASAQAELPVGIVTALMGVPFFLWLLQRTRRITA